MTYYIKNNSDVTLYKILTFCILIICPILSLPLIFLGIYKRYQGATIFFALFLAIFAYLLCPLEDLYRHTLNYYYWEGKTIHSIKFDDLQLNGIIVYLYQFMVNHDIPFDFIRLIEAPVSFLLFVNIFIYKLKHSSAAYTHKDLFLRFVILFLFFDYLYTIIGVRYGFALSIYLYGLHFAIDRNKKFKSFILFLIAALIHSSFFLLGLLSLILYRINFNKRTAIILAITVYFVLNFLLIKFGYLLGNRLEWYFSSKSIVSRYSEMSFFGIVGFWLLKSCAIPFVYLLYKYYDKTSKWRRISIVWFIISLAFIGNAVFFYRTWWVFMSIGIFLLLDIEQKILLQRYIIKILIFCGLIFTTFNTLQYRSFILHSRYYELTKPIPYILSDSYSLEWVKNNINNKGSYKGY